jgi:hypothetical protein
MLGTYFHAALVVCLGTGVNVPYLIGDLELSLFLKELCDHLGIVTAYQKTIPPRDNLFYKIDECEECLMDAVDMHFSLF